jgi:alpha-tubulin suppressor-like RCC1 family protein
MVSLGAEYSHVCASAPAATICWGANWEGELGDGVGMIFSAPREVVDLSNNIAMLSAGSNTCALDNTGAVKCWGTSWAGQLGNGTWDRVTRPTPVTGMGKGVQAISQFGETICALTKTGGVKCWGLNNAGQAGDGTVQADMGALTPVDVVGLQSGVTAVVSGRWHNCALLANRTARCWGANYIGQLGDGTTNDSSVPVAVKGVHNILALTAGSDHTCALLADRTVRCWGGNGDGQLGNGTFVASLAPVPVQGLTGVVAMESSLWNTCAITTTGALKCWGSSHTGQLGRGGYDPSNVPVDVPGMGSGVTSVSGGNDHFCAVKDGGVWCWGNNDRAQSGTGMTEPHLLSPVPVNGLAANVNSVTAGSDHTCAIAAGRAKCWGNNAGDGLGNGRKLLFAEPVTVLLERPREVALSYLNGAPGSFFTVRGRGFSANQAVTVAVSNQPAGNPGARSGSGAPTRQQMIVKTDAFGEFILFVDTRGADPGSYRVQAAGGAYQVTSVVTLSNSGKIHAQEGGGKVLSLVKFTYLPMLVR